MKRLIIILLALALAGCGSATTTSSTSPTATALPKPTATHATVTTATLGGTVDAFKATYTVSSTCSYSTRGLCFCASDGDTNCDYLLVVTPSTGRVTEVDLFARGDWALDFTLTWCLQFMPSGSSTASTSSGITTSGFYRYSSPVGNILMQIAPGSCELTFA